MLGLKCMKTISAFCWKNTFYISDLHVIFRKDSSFVPRYTKKLFILIFCIAHTGWNKSEVEAKRYTEQLHIILSIWNVYLYICLSTPTNGFSWAGAEAKLMLLNRHDLIWRMFFKLEVGHLFFAILLKQNNSNQEKFSNWSSWLFPSIAQ